MLLENRIFKKKAASSCLTYQYVSVTAGRLESGPHFLLIATIFTSRIKNRYETSTFIKPCIDCLYDSGLPIAIIF